MAKLYAEAAICQRSKRGEELCGDKVVVTRTENATIIVISDGLGSGVKANILATLTTKIASSMLRRGISLDDVVETIAETLPICRQRKIAYSTLQILNIFTDSTVGVIEMDCPPTLLINRGKVERFPVKERHIGGKMVKAGRIQLQKHDMLAAVSDGVLHAGMGTMFPFGWGLKGLQEHLRSLEPDCLLEEEARRMIALCESYYGAEAGDDSTVVLAKLHEVRKLSLLTGPPSKREQDRDWIENFLNQEGKKAIAGGTTANIVSRLTGRAITVDLVRRDQNVPPIGYMEGIDLVTEGILTLNAVLDRLGDEEKLADSSRQDGATLLARMMMESDAVTIFAGKAQNAANRNPNNPFQEYKKQQMLETMESLLVQKGKSVAVEWL